MKEQTKLFQDHHRYQAALRKASLGMGRIKDLRRLTRLIVQIVTRTVRLNHCEIYLFHNASEQHILKASKNKKSTAELVPALSPQSELVQHLIKVKEPLLASVVKAKMRNHPDSKWHNIRKEMRSLDSSLILPSFIQDRLLAIMCLGKRKNKMPFDQSDLVVFSILANQSALAIENAQFYEDMKKTHEQLFKAEKMATIGTMADGLSHQINNRLHAMAFIAGDALDTIRLNKDEFITPKKAKEVMIEIEYALNRIQENVKRGGEIVGGLLKYTRKGQQGVEPVDLDKLIDAAMEMALFKFKIKTFNVERQVNPNLPPINGNFTQLQEVFFNLIDNAYDAMEQRKMECNEKNYQPTISFYAHKKGKNIEILIKDNGIGVRPEDLKNIFLPFFTTKVSSQKGTGLGLYVIRQLIEESHHGKVLFTSVYKHGSQANIILPVYTLET
ncbi:MAG: GAF domain-containing sensor histidine kinase [Candidatus Omnitrophica bacterium]|nr:GAF domain-containing sensor histidine kinase [Candidatus Omnitrophota bacterium]